MKNGCKVVRNLLVCGGQPTIEGRRLTVLNVITGINNESSVLDYIHEYEISYSCIERCLNYCANLECKLSNKDKIRFCEGCTLDKYSTGNKDEIILNQPNSEYPFVTNNEEIFLGNIDEYYSSILPVDGWKLAKSIIESKLNAS